MQNAGSRLELAVKKRYCHEKPQQWKLFCHTKISFFTCKTDTSIHVHVVFSQEIQKLI